MQSLALTRRCFRNGSYFTAELCSDCMFLSLLLHFGKTLFYLFLDSVVHQTVVLYFFNVYFFGGGRAERERETQNPKQAPGFELSAQKPDAGLEPMNHEIMT